MPHPHKSQPPPLQLIILRHFDLIVSQSTHLLQALDAILQRHERIHLRLRAWHPMRGIQITRRRTPTRRSEF
jgi:hypothetical protein